MAWSIGYGAVAATVITVLGFFLGYASQRRSSRATGLISLVTLMMFAIPGTLIGIGLVITWNRPSLGWLYAGPATLVTGLVMQYVAIGERGIASTMSQISPSLEEAAEIAGASWLRRVWMILLPLLRPSLLAVWMLSFVRCLRDTSLALLLSSPGRDPLTARTLTLMANGSPELISALCLFSMALPVVPALIGFAGYRIGGNR
jgi:iron(III) transport system permease protein